MGWAFYDTQGRQKTVTQPATLGQPIVRARRTADSAGTTGYQGPLTFATEDGDVDNAWNGTKFQPTRPGWYQVRAKLVIQQAVANQANAVFLIKNGTLTGLTSGTPDVSYIQIGQDQQQLPIASTALVEANGLVYLNGTTDYVEVYAYMQTAGQIYGGTNKTYFEAYPIAAQGPAGSGPVPPGGLFGQTLRKTSSTGDFQVGWVNRTRRLEITSATSGTLGGFTGLDGDAERLYEINIEGYCVTSGANNQAIIIRPNNDATGNYAGLLSYAYWDVSYSTAGNTAWSLATPAVTTGLYAFKTDWNLAGQVVCTTKIGAKRYASGGYRPMDSSWTFRANNPSRQDASTGKSGGYWADTTNNITSMFFVITIGTFEGTITMRTID